jgi:3-oxoadipate enol-lactonase
LRSCSANAPAILFGHGHLAPAHFVGLSMGGFIGMPLAARSGELLRSLTLLGTNADGQDPESAKRFKQLATAYRLLGLSPIRRQVRQA